MRTRTVCTILAAVFCGAAVNAEMTYKQAHRIWLKEREKYHQYCRTKYEPGIALVKKEKELKKQIAERKAELYQADPKLKPLYEKYLEAHKAYKENKKDRHKRNALTNARRALAAEWKKSEGFKDTKLAKLKKTVRTLSWRDIYVGCRAKDPEAMKLFKAYSEKAKIKDQLKKAQKKK